MFEDDGFLTILTWSAQSYLSIFTQKYLRKYEDTYFILKNKHLCIYKDSFGAKNFRDDCTQIRYFFYLYYTICVFLKIEYSFLLEHIFCWGFFKQQIQNYFRLGIVEKCALDLGLDLGREKARKIYIDSYFHF